MANKFYIKYFMEQVQIFLDKNIPLKGAMDSFLDGASGGVDTLACGVEGVTQGVENISQFVGGLVGVASSVAAGASTMGQGISLAGAVINGLKIGLAGYHLLERKMGLPEPAVFLPNEASKEQDRLALEILFGEIALKLAMEYNYIIDVLATDEGIQTLACYAATNVMLQWLKLKTYNKPITLDTLCEDLFKPKLNTNTPIQVKKEYTLRGMLRQLFGSYSAENIYACPILIQCNLDEQDRWLRYSAKKSAGLHAYRVISENQRIIPPLYQAKTVFLDSSNVSSSFLVKYLIDSPQKRAVVEDYLQIVQENANFISLNEYLSQRYGINLIAACHDNSLQNLNLMHGDFSGVHFHDADLSGCLLTKTKWHNAYLQKATFGCTSRVIELRESSWNGAHLEYSQWINVNLNTIMIETNQRGATFTKCHVYQFAHINCNWKLSTWNEPVLVSQENLAQWPRCNVLLSKHKKKPRKLHGLLNEYENALRNKTLLNTFVYYIEPYVLPFQGADATRQPLSDMVDDFLKDENELLLLHGVVGSGKSSYARKLQKKLWDEWKDEQDWIPILIDMKDVTTKKSNFLDRYLNKKCQYELASLEELKNTYRFLIIFDGLDECKTVTYRSIMKDCQLELFANFKTIVTSRTEYVVSHEAVYQQFSRYKKREYFLTPITPADRDQYLINFFGEQAAQKYHDFLVSSNELLQLATSPLMLYILCSVLPRIEASNRSTPYTQIELYDLFFEEWVAREINKKDELSAISDITDEALKEKFFNYAESLAFNMFRTKSHICNISIDQNRPKLFNETKRLQQEDVWSVFFNPETQDLQHLCPLSIKKVKQKSSNVYRYQFIHESFREYFVATFLWRQDFDSKKIYWNYRYLTEEPGILKFLTERLMHSRERHNYEDELLELVLLTRQEPLLKKAASSAITLLNKVEYPFYNNPRLNGDLSNIVIPNADLTGVFLPEINIRKSDLQGATFHNAMMYGTKFDGSKLSKTRFSTNQLLVMIREKTNLFALNPTNLDEIAYATESHIFVVQLSTGEVIHHLEEQDMSKIKHLVFASNSTLACCDNRDNIFIWKNYQCVNTFKACFTRVSHLLFSPNSQILAVGSQEDEGEIYLLDIQSSSEEIFTRKCDSPMRSEIISLAFSSDGKMIAAGRRNTQICIWHIDGLKQKPSYIHSKFQHQDKVTTLLFSRDGSRLYSGSADKTVCIWNLQDGSHDKITGHTSGISSLALSPNEMFLASGSADHTIRIWAIQAWDKKSYYQTTLTGHADEIVNVVFTGDSKLISCSSDQTLRLWDLTHFDMSPDQSHNKRHIRPVSALSYSPDGQYLVSAGQDGAIHIWNKDGIYVNTLTNHTETVTCIAHAPNFIFASSSEDDKIKIWRADGQLLHELDTKSSVESLVFSPDGKKLASSHWDINIYIWNVEDPTSPTCQIQIKGHEDVVYGLAFNGDGSQLISGARDKTIRVWNLEEEKVVTEPNSLLSTPPRAKRSAATAQSMTRTRANREVKTVLRYLDQPIQIISHDEVISSIAYSSENRLIVGDMAGKINFYSVNVTHIIKIATMKIENNPISTLLVTKDGKRCLSGSLSSIALWDLDSLEQPIQTLPFGSSAIAFHEENIAFSHEKAIYLFNVQTSCWLKNGPCSFWPAHSTFRNTSGLDKPTANWLQQHGVQPNLISNFKRTRRLSLFRPATATANEPEAHALTTEASIQEETHSL